MPRQFSLRFWSNCALLLIFILHPSARALEAESSPHPGPRSAEEAELLLKEGNAAEASGKYRLAIRDFERFRARYPSDPKVETVYFQLIKDYTLLHEPQQVVTLTREILHRKLSDIDRERAQLALAISYFDLKKFPEARIAAEDLLKAKPSAENRTSANLIKLGALIEEKKFNEAHECLDQLKHENESKGNGDAASTDEIKDELILQNVRLSLAECGEQKKVEKKATEDDQIRYFKEKSLCYREIRPKLREAKKQDQPAVADLKAAWCSSYRSFVGEIKTVRSPSLRTKLMSDYGNPPEMVECNGQSGKK